MRDSAFAHVSAAWWDEYNEADRAARITDLASRMWRDSEPTRSDMVTSARVYGNTPLLGLSPSTYRQKRVGGNARRVSINGIKSVVDTYQSMVTKDDPKVTFWTSGGDWETQRRAKLLTKAIDGVFYGAQLRVKALQCVRDSALFPFGVAKVYEDWSDKDHPKVGIDRKKPWLILADDQDAADGDPQSLMEVMFCDRRALMHEYPDKAAEILSAGGMTFYDDALSAVDSDEIDLCAAVEAYHRPIDSDTPGRHSICIGNVLLVDEPYTRQRHPYEFLYRQRPLQGIHGDSLAMELLPLQVEVTAMLLGFQQSRRLAVGHWLVEENSRVNTNAINNVMASFVRYAGVKPEYVTYQHASGDDYAHLDRLWNKMFESVGVSAATAASQKPAGLNSGKAQLVYADVQAQRFKPSYEEYQQWHIALAHQAIHCMRSIAEKKPDFTVKAVGKSLMRAVKWADANLDDEEFTIQLLPTNKLADDPAAQMQDVQDKINAGMISPQNGARLLGLADNEAYQDLAQISYDLTMEAARRIQEEGEYFPPENYMDLSDAISNMQMAYNKARFDQVPEDKLAMMRRWMDEANDLLTPPAPPAPPIPAVMPPAMAPPANDNAMGAAPGIPGGIPGRVQALTAGAAASQTAGNLT